MQRRKFSARLEIHFSATTALLLMFTIQTSAVPKEEIRAAEIENESDGIQHGLRVENHLCSLDEEDQHSCLRGCGSLSGPQKF